MNDQSDSAEGAFAFQPGYQVFRQLNVFYGAAQHEIAGMQDEGFAVLNFHQVAEGFQAFLHVYEGLLVVAENHNFPVQVQVNAGGLYVGRVHRVDDDSAFSKGLPD